MLLRPLSMALSQRGGCLCSWSLFLPGLGAISKGASVFPLREAWCSLLAGCDNGPHMVVLQQLTKTRGLGAWAYRLPALPPLPPTPGPIKRSSSQPFVRALSLSRSSAGPLCPPIWGPSASASTPSALFTPPTICHQQVFQKCNECRSFCQRECA